MKTHNAEDTIKKVSFLLEKKEQFAFVTYTKSAISSVLNEISEEKKPPKLFTKLILDGLKNQSYNFICAIQPEIIHSSHKGLSNLNVDIKHIYDPNFLEYYIHNNYDVFKIFRSWYVKNTKAIVVTFQNQYFISKYFSPDSIFIEVPYNDYYSKINEITANIIAKSDGIDLVILDCPMLSAAIAPKIWTETNMSIFDFGRTLNALKSFNRYNDSKK